MPPGMRKHVRYPELMLQMQASVYGLYHMTDPGVFYNREDLWSVATEGGTVATDRRQTTQTMDPNLVLMTLPGETATEFVEILPFTPADRNTPRTRRKTPAAAPRCDDTMQRGRVEAETTKPVN